MGRPHRLRPSEPLAPTPSRRRVRLDRRLRPPHLHGVLRAPGPPRARGPVRGRFAADLRAWAEGGPFRLFVVADDAADTLTGAARELVERTLGRLARRGAIERIAVSGPGRLAGEVAALDGQLAAPVRLFTEAWHDAQAWLRSPSPPSDA